MSRYRRSFVPGGTFFFTLALADRSSTLLTDKIDRLRHAYRYIQQRAPFQTIAICVLPDHLHAIWTLPPNDDNYAQRWQQFKSMFSRSLPASETRSLSKALKREKGIWQRRYWEHQIRNEQDLEQHVQYIHFNPVKHQWVARVQDWPYSSFHRYVQQGLLAQDWAEGGTMEDRFGER